MTESLLAGNRLQVSLSNSDRRDLHETLTHRFSDIITIFSDLDANDAQVTKVDDREYILSRVNRLEEGFETVRRKGE